MSNFRGLRLAIGAGLAVAAGSQALAALGPDAGVCAAGNRPAILVKVIGLRDRTGRVRARTFGGSPSTFFNKEFALKRTEVDIPDSGPVEICMPVPRPGTYAVDIRHDVDGDGKTGKADGGGTSGNPKVSLLDIIFKRRPPASEVSVNVGSGVINVPIVVNYVQGGSVRPIQKMAR